MLTGVCVFTAEALVHLSLIREEGWHWALTSFAAEAWGETETTEKNN
jgi:hypothetical protein